MSNNSYSIYHKGSVTIDGKHFYIVRDYAFGTKLSWYERFETGFELLIAEGVYPGPTALNKILGNAWRRQNNLNGRESALRRQLMEKHEIPLKRPDSQSMQQDMYVDW